MILKFRCQFKVHEIEISKKSIEKEQHWRTFIYLFQNFLQSYRNKKKKNKTKKNKVTGIRQGGTSIRVDAEGRIDQWNRIKSTQINLHIYSQLLFGKDAKSNQQDKNSLFNK